MRKELIILAVCCALLPGCRPGSAFRWTQRDGALCLAKGDSVVGRLDIAETEGISHSERTERLDGQTFSITCVFKAARDVEDARLQMGFTHLSPSSYWMIPAVSYNGNHWGKGREPKGADENGQWRTVSYRRTPIPGAMYSEGSSYAFATWSEAPQGEREDFSVSIQPDGEQTRHCYLWPDEEMPVTYSGRDRFDKGYRKTCSLRKGEEVTMKTPSYDKPIFNMKEINKKIENEGYIVFAIKNGAVYGFNKNTRKYFSIYSPKSDSQPSDIGFADSRNNLMRMRTGEGRFSYNLATGKTQLIPE